MKVLKCSDCGNADDFERVARVTELWGCDNQGNRIYTIETYDCSPEQIECSECESTNIDWVSVD